MRVMMVGGGTGGHVMPALAVAAALRAKVADVEIRFAGTKRGLEANLIPSEGYQLLTLPARGVVGTSGRARWGALTNLGRAAWKAYRSMLLWRPDVVYATGGYVSPPVCLAARVRGIPFVIFEPNAIPGRANRWLSRFATEVHLGNSMARSMLPRRDTVRLTGVPVRQQVLFGNRTRAIRMYRLDPGRFTVFVLGGSQGAHAINALMVEALKELRRRDDIQFVLQSGTQDYKWLLSQVRPLPIRTWVRPFIHQMGDAWAVADLVIGRAGALSVAEICATGTSAILIPYPHAADNHQEANARYLEEVEAAKVFKADKITGPVLAREIENLLDHYPRLRALGMKAHQLARFDAAEKAAQRLLALAGEEIPVEEKPRRRRRKRKGSM
jgi:UDP-N-acetylglucosamine--N-acetylmuramyl-(pentapeptide) pyrophosphoryl-undecaprenol N-acetylglucosamine transferase